MPGSTRIWFSEPLETVAIWWRVERPDGVTLGFTSHDRDLAFGGLVHRTAPGMVPSAIRRTADFQADSAEIAGALSHDSIREDDLTAGRFDGASVAMGLIDWENLDQTTLYAGTIGAVGHEGAGFSAELRSIKELLARQIVPRTSPTCRADFCGAGCTLAAVRYTHAATLAEISADSGSVRISGGPGAAALLSAMIGAGPRRESLAIKPAGSCGALSVSIRIRSAAAAPRAALNPASTEDAAARTSNSP
jgi:hypothetical protein